MAEEARQTFGFRAQSLGSRAYGFRAEGLEPRV